MKNRVILFLIRSFLWRVVLWWCATLSIKKTDNTEFDAVRLAGKNYVAAFWHGSMLLGWFVNRPERDLKISAVVSKSSDGEFLSGVIQRWGFSMIRGSSHIGGKEAMQMMTEAVKNGNGLCITPDGPRGPRHEMKMGAVRVAQKTGVPLFLIGIGIQKKKVLQSWDQFEIPIPFSSVNILFSKPINVPENYSGESLEAFKRDMQNQLNHLQNKAEIFS